MFHADRILHCLTHPELLLNMTEKQAQEIVEYLRDIKIALEGNSKLGIEGAFKMLQRHDKWITKMNLRMAMWSGIGAAVGAYGLPGIKELVKLFHL